MSAKKKQNIESFEDIEMTLTRAEQFVEKNQRMLIYVFIGVLVVVGAAWGYANLQKTNQKEALSRMFVAEQYFEKDSFNLAIHGDGNNPGFIEIADQYSSTKAGNLANYYIGVSYLNLGNPTEAIRYLEQFSSDDIVISTLAVAAIGDAYLEQEKYEKAVSYYLEAADKNENNFSTPIYLKKAALTYEQMNKYKEALRLYQRIKDEYKNSEEGRYIDKYITKVKLLASNS